MPMHINMRQFAPREIGVANAHFDGYLLVSYRKGMWQYQLRYGTTCTFFKPLFPGENVSKVPCHRYRAAFLNAAETPSLPKTYFHH